MGGRSACGLRCASTLKYTRNKSHPTQADHFTAAQIIPASVRQAIAHRYDAAFAEIPYVEPLRVQEEMSHAYHLYVIRLNLSRLQATRADVFSALQAEGIGVNVHYIPVHLHPFYREQLGTEPGMCPVAEAAYEQILSLPIFPRMSDTDVDDVTKAVRKVMEPYSA